MKRPLIIIGLVIVVAAVFATADLTVQTILDRKLPQLLTRELGLPVTLAPLRADVITLTVRTEKLVMGPANDPAVVADNVSVSLNWSDLMRGEIRLITASGDNVMLKLSQWPSSEEPPDADYLFLDPWLPRSLAVKDTRFVWEDGSDWNLLNGEWQRQEDGGASLKWQEKRPGGSFQASVQLKSLNDLLALRDYSSDVLFAFEDAALAESKLRLDIKPGAKESWTLDLSGSLAGMDITLNAQGEKPWEMPQHSKTRITTLYPARVQRIFSVLYDDGTDDGLTNMLQKTLPALSLPVHEGSFAIGDVQIYDEPIQENSFEFSSKPGTFSLTRITMQGPAGTFSGTAELTVTESNTWKIVVDSKAVARGTDAGLLPKFVDNDWLWQDGVVKIDAAGNTWGGLLDSMSGALEISGIHRGKTKTPFALKGIIGGSPSAFAIENIQLALGGSSAEGSVEFSGGSEPDLKIVASSPALDLRFLFDDGDISPAPGIAIPEYLGAIRDIDVTASIDVKKLNVPSVALSSARLDLKRGAESGELSIKGTGLKNGDLDIKLQYQSPADAPTEVKLSVDLSEFDLDAAFGEGDSVLESLATGSMVFTTVGNSIPDMFKAMRGDARLTIAFRDDADWQRESRKDEQLGFSGKSSLVISGNRIVGVKIDDLAIDSVQQDLSGTVSMVTNRDPVLQAKLESHQLNLDKLLTWLPKSPETASDTELLQTLRLLGSLKVSLHVGSLRWLDKQATDVTVGLDSGIERFSVKPVQFTYEGARLDASGDLLWQDDIATLSASGSVDSIVLQDLVGDSAQDKTLEEPLEGNFSISGQGNTMTELLTDIAGEIKLEGQATDSAPANKIDIDLIRLADGGEAKINSLNWAGSNLRGKVRMLRGTTPAFDVTLAGGILDLRPWENEAAVRRAAEAEQAKAKASDSSIAENVLSSSTRLVGDVLSAPARFFEEQATKPGQRIFSSEPLDVAKFRQQNLTLTGELDEIQSNVGEIRNLTIDLALQDGVLDIEGQAGYINSGKGRGKLHFDSTASPPTGNLDTWFQGVYGEKEKASFSRDGHAILSSTGASQAELAGNLSGAVYLKSGSGPLEYDSLTLITTDAASGMFRALIPGAKDRKPTLDCGITLGKFTDGVGVTPYGWAIRTRTANLLGAMELDLKKEIINISFQSRSREGIGLSLGNAFSNSVNLAGPLSDPRIVPNTPSLLIRGWAAFMTAGLSVLGESAFNRAMASGNPCKSIDKEIRKDLCKPGLPFADSPIACALEGSGTEGSSALAPAPDSDSTGDQAPATTPGQQQELPDQ